jgi:aminoglycoside phosphotransferase (APT) family kinase protein
VTNQAADPAETFEAVLAALRAGGRISPASTVRPLAGGVSSFIAVVDEDSRPRVVKASRHRLAVAQEWTADPRRAHREGAILATLDGQLGPLRTPKVYHVHEQPPVLELEWIAPPAVSWKAELLAGRVDASVAASLGAGLSVLHQLPVPDSLDAEAGAALFESLRLRPYYRTVAAVRPEYAAALRALIGECTSQHPGRLVHGDVTPKNVLVAPSAPVLLDWEVVHSGDPAFDVGMLTAHLLLKACLAGSDAAGPLLAAAAALTASYDGPAEPRLIVRHTGAVMLARLWGTSPVEYLTGERQREVAARLASRALLAGFASVPEFLADLRAEDM